MKKYILRIALMFVVACSTKDNNHDKPKTPKVNTIPSLANSDSFVANHNLIRAIEVSPNPSAYFDNEDWKEYESTGDPDTAIALFTYRIIKTNDTTFDAEEEHIRMYLESTQIKQTMVELFKSDTAVENLIAQLDKLNLKFRKFAEAQVASDIKQFGESDGPLGEFVSGLK